MTVAPDLSLLTAGEVGAILGKSADWVARKASAGEIASVRIGQSLRFRPQAVEDYLQAATRPASLGRSARSRRRRTQT